jgi:hypothetical protein
MTEALPRDRLFNWVRHGETMLRQVGIFADGSLYNPNNYPPETVREAVLAALQRRHTRRSEAAKEAAQTRKQRQQAKVYAVAKRIVAKQNIGPREHCYVCGRSLDDPQSINRGIGSECWQYVLDVVAALQRRQEAAS